MFQVLALKEKLEMKERATESSELLNKLSQGLLHNPGMDSASDGEVSKVPILAWNPEDIHSTKRNMFDPGSPHFTDGSHCSLLDPGDYSYIF